MKSWWLTTGWPWLRENWAWVLILPVIGLVWLAMRAQRLVIVDPVRRADERAEEEQVRRVVELEMERERLAKKVAEVTQKHEELVAELESKLAEPVGDLRSDPDALRRYMLESLRR